MFTDGPMRTKGFESRMGQTVIVCYLLKLFWQAQSQMLYDSSHPFLWQFWLQVKMFGLPNERRYSIIVTSLSLCQRKHLICFFIQYISFKHSPSLSFPFQIQTLSYHATAPQEEAVRLKVFISYKYSSYCNKSRCQYFLSA